MNYDVVIDKTIDQFLIDFPAYDNVPWTTSRIYVSEAATLSQSNVETATYLYVIDLILGENSTGTAIVKDGYLSITKSDFDLLLVLAGSPVPEDVVCPRAPALTDVSMWQATTVPEGRSIARIEWTIPTLNELNPQLLGIATGGSQTFDFTFDPVQPSSELVLEITGYGSGSTALTHAFLKDQDILQVSDTTGFSVGDYVEVDDLTRKNYYEVSSVDTYELRLTTRCDVFAGFAIGSTVKGVTAIVKASPTDYTIDYTLGQVTTVPGQFGAGNKVAAFYVPIIQDLGHFELYRVPGDHLVDPAAGYSAITKADVLAAPGMVIVDDSIGRYTSNLTETLPPSVNGETWTYYMFSVDTSAYTNASWASSAMVETVPSIPRQLSASVGNAKVLIDWDHLEPSSDGNTDGFNIYRCDGPVYTDALGIRVNSTVIPKGTPEFEDSAANLINRRPSSEVPYPVNGMVYSYKIESEDTLTEWSVGTKNQDIETGAAIYVASKTP